jgi:hypothetical protein
VPFPESLSVFISLSSARCSRVVASMSLTTASQQTNLTASLLAAVRIGCKRVRGRRWGRRTCRCWGAAGEGAAGAGGGGAAGGGAAGAGAGGAAGAAGRAGSVPRGWHHRHYIARRAGTTAGQARLIGSRNSWPCKSTLRRRGWRNLRNVSVYDGLSCGRAKPALDTEIPQPQQSGNEQ